MQRWLRQRTEVVALAVCVVAAAVFAAVGSDKGLRPEIFGLGGVAGAGLVLNAVAIVLVYRATKVINFAQLNIGVVSAALFLQLVHARTFIRGTAAICPPCVPKPRTVGQLLDARGLELETLLGGQDLPPRVVDRVLSMSLDDPRVSEALPTNFDYETTLSVIGAPSWMIQLNYWIALAVSLTVAVALTWVLYRFVIKRFSEAPRLILTVATLAAGVTARFIGFRALNLIFGQFETTSNALITEGPAPVPIGGSLNVGVAVFTGTDLFTVVAGLAGGLGLLLYFKKAKSGIALRASAENQQRARTLGVNVEAVTARAWVIAGLLAGVASIVAAADTGRVGWDYGMMVRTLAAAVAGGMVAVPLTIVSAFAIGVIDQLVFWASGSQGAVDGFLLVFIVLVLLAQRARSSRADIDANAAWVASRELRPIPHVLRRLPPVRNTLIALAVVTAVWMLAYPWFMSPGQVNIAGVNMILAMVALSLLILTGWAGQMSLAQMAFAAVGAYVTAVVALPFPMPLFVGAIGGALTAAIIGIPALRLRGLFLAITTLAFALATVSVLLEPRYLGRHLPDAVERPSFLGIDFVDDRAYYYLLVVLLATTVAMVTGLRRSRTARALIASKDNEQATQSFGINLLRARLSAFALSGAIAGFAGGLLTYAQFGVKIASYDPEQSVRVFLMALIGGLGSIAGPVLGAFYVGMGSLLAELGWGWAADYLFSPGIGLLALLVFAPGGLAQLVWTVRDAWLRRIATRYRLVVPSLTDADLDALPIAPKTRPGGGTLFIPIRYRLADQWMVEAQRERVANGG